MLSLLHQHARSAPGCTAAPHPGSAAAATAAAAIPACLRPGAATAHRAGDRHQVRTSCQFDVASYHHPSCRRSSHITGTPSTAAGGVPTPLPFAWARSPPAAHGPLPALHAALLPAGGGARHWGTAAGRQQRQARQQRRMPLPLSQPLITALAVVPPLGTIGSGLLCKPRGIRPAHPAFSRTKPRLQPDYSVNPLCKTSTAVVKCVCLSHEQRKTGQKRRQRKNKQVDRRMPASPAPAAGRCASGAPSWGGSKKKTLEQSEKQYNMPLRGACVVSCLSRDFAPHALASLRASAATHLALQRKSLPAAVRRHRTDVTA